MVNKVKYNEYPNKLEFEKLYETNSQSELADYYGCNKKRIKKWIDYFGLQSRMRGGGNNKKYSFEKTQLKELVDAGYTNEEICQILQIKSKSSLNKWFRKFGIIREYQTTEYNIYCRKVRWLTEKNYVLYEKTINPNSYPRTLCGVDDGYQLDHIKSIKECFINNISIEICASIENLQMIPWKQNLIKRTFKGAKNAK